MRLINKDLPIPYLTVALNALTIGVSVYFFIYSGQSQLDNNLLRRIGAPDAYFIYSGEWWGILTNSFVHLSPIILAFNIAGLWILGAFLERRSGWFQLFILGTFASILTSSIQLNITEDPGSGMSGVNYFLLGYLIVLSNKNEKYSFKLRWLAITLGTIGPCLIFASNYFMKTNIGLEAIISGFLAGLTAAFLKSKIQIIGTILLATLLSFLSLLYAPWSALWNFRRATVYHIQNDLLNAERYYDKALAIDPSLDDARYNSFLIKIDRLSDKAFKLHNEGNYREARKVYEEILEIDPQNNWAKQQIKVLP